MASNQKPVLYGYFRSSCSARVRIALNLKGIEFDQRPVNLLKQEHHDPAYQELNSSQLVPTLVIDGHTLTQSGAILEYLEETRPTPPLLPQDPIARAKIRALCNIIGCDIQPVQAPRLFPMLGDVNREDWSKHWITVGFRALEKELAKTAGKYCYGDTITMADLYLPPQVYNATRFGVDMSEFPIISRIDQELAKIDAFARAHWSRQPDCPESLRVQASSINNHAK
jgi:maleylacetoacetate isomerase